MAMETQTHLTEAMLTEILARLPLISIARFKTVCKTWKTTLESPYFRRLFVSAHQNSSSSWSLVCGSKELIGFHGCKTWNLPKSLIPPSLKGFSIGDASYTDSSSGMVVIDSSDNSYCYVGNPVLQQWVRIPPAPIASRVFGLVTRVDEDRVVSSFKVIRLATVASTGNDLLSCILYVFIYSSEIGIWSFKKIYSPHQIVDARVSVDGVLVAHDFYSESNEFRDIALKIWRLNNDDETWKLLWVFELPSTRAYVPMAMHPFDIGTIYLCSHHDHQLVSCNLRTLNCTILKDGYNDDGHQDCFIDQSVCDDFVHRIPDPVSFSYRWGGVSVRCFPLVLPRWMGSVPCPPQAEMIDTISLLSFMTST
ncbi:unnamed protein product [Eruca vesicaria subsp. sativa]|uniref:F-box domain-containing protein n=1 Tax=Eruca vesicaria subsp. sativa TaxID=29727 RepID=A0ABC8M3B9_ERUVS|nr:unnamed protein product [Eruca vesicaria subsp. sativa]